MRILVVEDEPAMNELLVKQLKAAHYSVDGCLNGADAMDYLAGAEYDAVVLDLSLIHIWRTPAFWPCRRASPCSSCARASRWRTARR